MLRVCECFDRWGESSPDCEWGFEPRHGNEIYCRACKPVAQRARIRAAVQRFRGTTKLEELVESTDREWTATWIDVRCGACGEKGVPTFNRTLCYACWSEGAPTVHVVHPQDNCKHGSHMDMTPRDDQLHGKVKHFSSEDYTQEQLRAILKGE